MTKWIINTDEHKGAWYVMRIFKDQTENYNKIINKYNTIFNGDNQLDWATVINSAVANLLKSNYDLKNLKNYNYYTKDENRWEYKYVKLDYNLYKQLADKLNLKSYLKNAQEDKLDNVVNTALYKAIDLKWKLRKQIIDAWKDKDDDEDIAEWKRLLRKVEIDNNGWNINKLMLVLKSTGVVRDTEDYKTKYVKGNEIAETKCPLCDTDKDKNTRHCGWIITENVPNFYCQKCGKRGTIFTALKKLLDGVNPIDYIYNILYGSGKEVIITKFEKKNINEIEKAKAERIRKEEEQIEKTGQIAEGILEECTQNNWYLQKMHFTKKDFGTDVYYRDFTISSAEDKDVKYWSNMFRGSVIYVIKDTYGKIIGLKGRRTGKFNKRGFKDTEEDILEIIKGDEWFSTQKSDLVSKLKINLIGTKTDNSLFLLSRYSDAPREYNKLVITEGEKDALRIASKNFAKTAVVASYGCKLTSGQIQLIKDFKKLSQSELKIVISYDNDTAGINGSIRAYKKLKAAGFKNIVFGNYKDDRFKDAGEMYWRKDQENYITSNYIFPLIYTDLTIKDYVEKAQKNSIEIKEELMEIEELKDVKVDKTKKTTLAEDAENYWANVVATIEKENNNTTNAKPITSSLSSVTV
ncbi:toprim domain-containing protein [Clostridium sp. JN-9]|uniref:toprim domain-containing protein n=1 Tax=Clostridium sp. JN-9 TaxID=2507159 RepID=UPI000FFE0469|nr:toprim domain-containing protein [Clostridium sp. JN-9]QAT39545.1 toprim domain-containing protein [Clostridium sp. JN-9]